jgi:hypothetical protein
LRIKLPKTALPLHMRGLLEVSSVSGKILVEICEKIEKNFLVFRYEL